MPRPVSSNGSSIVPDGDRLAPIKLTCPLTAKAFSDFAIVPGPPISTTQLALFSATRSEPLLSQATADYAVVRKLVTDVFAEGIEAAVRETVDAVAALKKNEVSLGELAGKLALDKSVTSRRLRDATDRGYLVNRDTRSGRPARIVLGDPMPEMVKLLPKPHEPDS